MRIKLLLLTAALGLAGASVRAETIIGFEVNGVLGDVTSLVAATLNENLTATDLIRSDELGPNAGANSFNSNTWNITDTFDVDTNYLSFSFSTASGYMLNIDSLEYNMASSPTAPNTGRWGYSINGGSFELQEAFTIASGTGGGDGSWTNIGLEDTSGTIEFRYWQWGADRVATGDSQNSGTSRIRNLSGDDLLVTGSVTVIPEPSTLVLMGMTALAAFGILRRRRK